MLTDFRSFGRGDSEVTNHRSVLRIVTMFETDSGQLAVNLCGQARKGVWGMSRRQKAMKGVEGCEKPGGVVKRALIPGFLNYCMLNT